MQNDLSSPALHIVVFSNFEGFCQDPAEAQRIVQGFEAITDRHPEIVWTHMFNPIHLRGPANKCQCREVFLTYLHALVQRQPRTDVGLHLHMFYGLVEALGMVPRSFPYADAPVGQGHQPRGLDGDGYDVLLTGYPVAEQRQLIERCCDTYQQCGLRRPTAFCAGYSATNPALQALLDQLGFTASCAAQAVPPGIAGVSYPPAWYELLEWAENITPLSKPYRVGTQSILPPPAAGPFLDHLVEIPLNTDTDLRPPYLRGRPIGRTAILDAHYQMVQDTGRSSCVALGVHDVYLGDVAGRGPLLAEMAANLDHVRKLGRHGAVPVRFATASEVADRVRAETGRW